MQRWLLLFAACVIAVSEAKSTYKRHYFVRQPQPLTECSEGTVKCKSSGKCIPEAWMCDEEDDCGDKSDEPDSCRARACAEGELECDSGQCVNKLNYCFGIDSCRDGSTFLTIECPHISCAAGQVKCSIMSKCIRTDDVCDEENDCGDLSDEPSDCRSRQCAEGELRCNSGQCVSLSNFCKYRTRCKDGSALGPANCSQAACNAGEFECKKYSMCIEAANVCNGYDDCGDMSDEPSNCRERQCAEGEVRCNNGQCLNQKDVCLQLGFHYTCRDRTSLSSVCERFTCPLGWVKCSSGEKCVKESSLCDGIAQCSDKSDESPEHCDRPLVCDTSREFRCKKFRRCVSRYELCDNFNDCGDNSDEDETLCSSRGCRFFDVRCNNGQCLVKHSYCNGFTDCADNSLMDRSKLCGSSQFSRFLESFF